MSTNAHIRNTMKYSAANPYWTFALLAALLAPACAAISVAAVRIPTSPLAVHKKTGGKTAQARWNVQLGKLSLTAGGTGGFMQLSDVRAGDWSKSTGLVITISHNGQTTKSRFATADILELTRIGADIAPARGWQVLLRNGSVVAGQPQTLNAGDLTIKARGIGMLDVPLADVAAVRYGAVPAIRPVATPNDTLYLTNGTTLVGAMNTLGPTDVQWSTSLGNATVPWSRIRYMVLGGAVGTMPVHGLAQRVCLSHGSVLLVHNLTWKSGLVTCQGPGGKPLSFLRSTVLKVSICGGQAQWLTDFSPSIASQVPYFGEPNQWPARRNLNVMGGPLRADGRRFSHGLGVHATSTLTYTLNGGYRRFVFLPAMDQSAAPFGQSQARVLLDGKVIWHSGLLQVGTPLQLVNLNVTNGRVVSLQVTDGARFDVRARMDWLDAALLRK